MLGVSALLSLLPLFSDSLDSREGSRTCHSARFLAPSGLTVRLALKRDLRAGYPRGGHQRAPRTAARLLGCVCGAVTDGPRGTHAQLGSVLS